jgi:fructose-bisphosphate aldolase class 1
MDFEVAFKTSIKEHSFKEDEVYFTYGSLVYALPISSQGTISKNFPVSGFHDYQYSPIGFARYLLSAASNLAADDSKITGIFLNEKTQKQENRELVPMGKTILRQVTFQKE